MAIKKARTSFHVGNILRVVVVDSAIAALLLGGWAGIRGLGQAEYRHYVILFLGRTCGCAWDLTRGPRSLCLSLQIKFLRIRSEGGDSKLYCCINVIIITYYVGAIHECSIGTFTLECEN